MHHHQTNWDSAAMPSATRYGAISIPLTHRAGDLDLRASPQGLRRQVLRGLLAATLVAVCTIIAVTQGGLLQPHALKTEVDLATQKYDPADPTAQELPVWRVHPDVSCTSEYSAFTGRSLKECKALCAERKSTGFSYSATSNDCRVASVLFGRCVLEHDEKGVFYEVTGTIHKPASFDATPGYACMVQPGHAAVQGLSLGECREQCISISGCVGGFSFNKKTQECILPLDGTSDLCFLKETESASTVYIVSSRWEVTHGAHCAATDNADTLRIPLGLCLERCVSVDACRGGVSFDMASSKCTLPQKGGACDSRKDHKGNAAVFKAKPLDVCTSGLCFHSSSCTARPDDAIIDLNSFPFECDCPKGWTGPRCAQDVDECTTSPQCGEGAQCINTDGSFDCACPGGYEMGAGGNCAEVDDCEAPAARARCSMSQHMQCVDGHQSYRCACDDGFGLTDGSEAAGVCVDLDECAPGGGSNCADGALCTNTAGSFTCACPVGYTGDGVASCEEIDECAPAPCGAHAACKDGIAAFTCRCDDGFFSDDGSETGTCTDLDECILGTHECDAPSEAQCVNTEGSYVCTCNSGFSLDKAGHSCADIDECAAVGAMSACAAGAKCRNTAGSFTCVCEDGYAGDGVGAPCVDIDECAEGAAQLCGSSSFCVNTPGTFHCECKTGYASPTGTMRSCEDVDECATGMHSCGAAASGGICTNIAGGYTCSCADGFLPTMAADDAVVGCNDIDECALGTHDCVVHGRLICKNTIGSFACGCMDGYAQTSDANGSDSTQPCIDVDECAAGMSKCKAGAACVNTDGSYVCACGKGYRGDASIGCFDIDECLSWPCSSAATCLNTDGGHTCTCNEGFTGDGTDCVDVDECSTSTPCAPYEAQCVNVIGSFKCHCSAGFIGHVLSDLHTHCRDIDECLAGTHNCQPPSDCMNTHGGFDCIL